MCNEMILRELEDLLFSSVDGRFKKKPERSIKAVDKSKMKGLIINCKKNGMHICEQKGQPRM